MQYLSTTVSRVLTKSQTQTLWWKFASGIKNINFGFTQYADVCLYSVLSRALWFFQHYFIWQKMKYNFARNVWRGVHYVGTRCLIICTHVKAFKRVGAIPRLKLGLVLLQKLMTIKTYLIRKFRFSKHFELQALRLVDSPCLRPCRRPQKSTKLIKIDVDFSKKSQCRNNTRI